MRKTVALSAFAVQALVAEPAHENLVLVADSRNYTGLLAWWTNLYNESHLLLAVATVIIIPSLGFIMGKITEFAMARLGINLKSRVLAEH
jgi:hypothetical protein